MPQILAGILIDGSSMARSMAGLGPRDAGHDTVDRVASSRVREPNASQPVLPAAHRLVAVDLMQRSGARYDGAVLERVMPTFDHVGPEADPILRNLHEHYVHDMSEWLGINVRADGAFGHDTSSLWRADVAVTLARVGGELAGFGIVSSAEKWLGKSAARDIKDFFILRRYRHQGAGDALAKHLWDASPAEWLVRVLAANKPAASFWRRMVRSYSSGRYEERAARDGDRDWIQLRFDNGSDIPTSSGATVSR